MESEDYLDIHELEAAKKNENNFTSLEKLKKEYKQVSNARREAYR